MIDQEGDEQTSNKDEMEIRASPSMAEDVAYWQTHPGAAVVEGPIVENPMSEAERIVHMKQMPKTSPRKWTSAEPSNGIFAI